MNTGIINFCGRNGINIKSNNIKKKILEELENKFKIKIIQKHFEKFDPESSLIKINKIPHLISVKSNGNPYLLYLTKYNFINQCIFIDKKIQQGYFEPRMIISKINFEDSLFENTLFDGEMVKLENNKWLFLINDIICYKDEYLEKLNIIKRLDIVYDILQNKLFLEKDTICNFKVKKYFIYDEKYHISKFVENLPYTSRGIYFKPLYLKFKDILYNFSDDLIKSVKREKLGRNKDFMLNEEKKDNKDFYESVVEDLKKKQNKIETDKSREFLIEKRELPDSYILTDKDTGNSIGLACIPNMVISRFLQELFLEKPVNTKLEISCEFDNNFKRWKPLIPN